MTIEALIATTTGFSTSSIVISGVLRAHAMRPYPLGRGYSPPIVECVYFVDTIHA